MVILVAGSTIIVERIDDSAAFTEQKWEALKTNDKSNQEQSRYLGASGSGTLRSLAGAW